MKRSALRTGVLAAILAAAGTGTTAHATNYSIDWLNMGPTPFGSSVPNNSNFLLPGVGLVNVSYSIPPNLFIDARTQNPVMTSGSVTSGPDTYSWSNYEAFSATLLSGPDPLVPVSWSITFTFPTTQAAGTIYVGGIGFGSTTSFGGGSTVATVLNNGTFLGDYNPTNVYGPTQFTAGSGIFTMQNSLSAPGGIDPHWNTPLGVVRIDDAVSSITVRFSHIRGDGAGVNIGFALPSPGAAAVLGLGGVLAMRRRRA